MRSTRPIALALTLAFLATFVLSGWAMVQRVREYNRTRGFVRYHFQARDERSFSVFDRPVTIEDARDEQGRSVWKVAYGDDVALVPVKPPPVENAPKLGLYDEWAKPIASIELKAGVADDVEAAGLLGTERMTIVSRIPSAGLDPQTWGSVKRDEWTFQFLTLKREGGFEHAVRRWPRTDRGEKKLAAQARGEMPGLDAESARALLAVEPLKERSLEYQLALHVIPKLNVPKYKFKDDAVTAMGWTLPVAFFSFLGMTVAGIWAAAPRGAFSRATPSDRGNDLK